jgi:hypothetical protein
MVVADEQENLNGRLVKYQNVQGSQIEMDNTRDQMITKGPGVVRIFQPGGQDPANPQPKPKNGKATTNDELKLTWVKFDKQMIAYNSMPKRAVFRSNCEMVHMASQRHDVEIDITKLPQDALYLKCKESLEVTTQSRKVVDRDGKEIEIKWQEMISKGDVRVKSDEYDGWANTVTFSEEKSLLIFIGSKSNPAVMSRAEVVGGERKTFRGEKITYNTKTKDFSVEGGVGGGAN